MHNRSPVVLFISIIFFLSSFLITPQIEAKFVLSPMENTANKDLRGITGSSPTDVYAVGKKGTILHYDGTQCKQLPNPSRENLNGVWGSFENGVINVFAVGDRGTILHYDGAQCKQLPTSSRENLNGVWGSFEKGIINVFAVGDRGTILRYDGTQWFQMSNPEQIKLNGIWGSSSNSIFAVGDRGTILYFNGTRWLSLPKCTMEDLNAVSGCCDKTGVNVYASGEKGTILHFDGVQWTKMSSPVDNNLNDIYARQPNNIIAVGKKNTVIHFDGEKWSQVTEPAHANLFAVWVSENPHVFVVGQNGIYSYPQPYTITGGIFDSCANCSTPPISIVAQVEALVGQTWVWQATTTSGVYSPITFTSDNKTLRFSAANYKPELINVTLLNNPSRIITTNTYLLHNTNSLNCISGVISQEINVPPTFNRSISPTPTPLISVQLYQVVNCAWSPLRSTNANDKGHYCFCNLGDGTYKVEPQRAGYTYNPEYDNINIAIPQTVPQAYNFTQQ